MTTYTTTHQMDTVIHSSNAERPKSMCRYCGTVLTGTTSVPFSPIPELLGSNAVPTEAQQFSIRGAINTALVDARRLDEEIRCVSQVLAQLQAERQELQQFVDTHHAFLTPARRVYPEVWAEIFKYCSNGSRRKRFPEVVDSFDPGEGPLVLTQVCMSWRNIAISTPQLWTTIRVTFGGSNAYQYALVSTWIRRSGGLPLTVAILEAKPSAFSRTYSLLNWEDDETLRELCSSSRRWKKLFLMLPASDSPWFGLESIRHELSSLQNLVVFTSRRSVPPDMLVSLFEEAPLLHSLSLDYSMSLSILQVPLSQITCLEFKVNKHTPASINTCLTALGMATNVHECILHVGAPDPWIAIPTIHHSRLQKLFVIAEPLRDNTQKGLERLWCNLFVPNLKVLKVHSVANGRHWDHYAYGHFLSRTPLLEILEINCDIIKGSELLEELREATSVSSLALSVPTRPMEELLDYLSSTDAVNLLPFLIHLHSISFEAAAKPEFIYRIRNMFACRTMLAKMNRTANLMFVKYDFSSSFSPRLDCSGHGTDARESLFTVTRQPASCVFRRRPQQVTPISHDYTPGLRI